MDQAELEALCRRIIAENPRQAEAYHQGRTVLGFFVGKVMVATQGTVSPQQTHETFRLLLDAQ